MAHEIERIREQLADVLVPQIDERVSDAQLGVAVFSDFGERELGEQSHPYVLLQAITPDVDRVVAATERIELEWGGDSPETQLEALYQVATGEGLGIYVDPGPECPAGSRGGVCFRPGTFAIVMLFTDAPMRNVVGIQPTGEPSPVEFAGELMDVPYIPYSRGYEETLEALGEAGIHVVGLWSGATEGLDDMRRVVRDSGSVDAAGQPIVFEIGGRGEELGDGVIRGFEAITSEARYDLQLELADADLEDGVDPRVLVTSVRALSADPAEGAVPAGDRFTSVSAGTRVTFELVFDPSTLPRAAFEQRFPLTLRVVANDGTVLSTETVDVVIGADACAASEA
jgi:hypothetical protein